MANKIVDAAAMLTIQATVIKQLEDDNTVLKAENEHLRKQVDALRSLVDGAYEIVELHKVLPGQVALEKWKENWLAKAREHGCGGE